jgi:hypothetical protein
MTDAKLGIDYLNKFYSAVAGYSSHFSAEVAAALLLYQSEQGITGNIGEIGVMKGRSFIALALHSQPDDLCIAVDNFVWPPNVFQIFEENCRTYGVDMARLVSVVANTQDLKSDDIMARSQGRELRYLHIDGGHEPWILASDLELAYRVMAKGGILCLDDMLHPQYPQLPVIVHAFLAQHPDLTPFCVVDRADFFAAAKYLICGAAFAERYQTFLREKFASYAMPVQAEFAMSRGLILTQDIRLQAYYEKLIHG